MELKEGPYEVPALLGVLGSPPGPAAPCGGVGMGYRGCIIARGTEIAGQFPVQSTGRPSEFPGDGGHGIASGKMGRKKVSFFLGEL